MGSFRAGALAAAFLPLLPAPALAEDDATASLPLLGEEVVVVGHRDRPSDATAASTVIDAQKYAGESKTVAELVTAAPGVAVNGYGGLGQFTTLSIRGSDPSEVQVFLDGLPLNTAAGGGVDLSRIPRSWIDRIEVVRGAAGSTYGPGAMGGAVDVVTRREAAGSWSANASGGSFGTFSGGVDGALGGSRWGLLLAGAFDHSDGRFPYKLNLTPNSPTPEWEAKERDHDGSSSGGGLVKLWAQLGSASLDSVLQVSGGQRDLPGTAFQFTPSDWEQDLRVGVVNRLVEPLSDDVDLVFGLTYREDRLNLDIYPFEFRQRDHAGEVSSQVTWRAGPSVLALRAAGSYERLDVLDGGHEWGGLALSASDTFTLGGGRLQLTPSVRYDRQGPFEGVSSRLGGRLAFNEVLSVRASGGRAFRIPSFAELYLQQGVMLPNPALVPERSWSADAALAAEGRFGLASAGVFTQRYDDQIYYEAIWQGRMKPFNVGRSTAHGMEVELASAPVSPAAVAASLAYTYLFTETLRADALKLGKELPHRAPHRLFARLAAAPGPFEVHGEVHFVAAQWNDIENTQAQHIPAALTINAGISARIVRAPDLHLGLEVRNLLDDRSLQDGFGYPLPGRMVLVTLRMAGGKEKRTP